MFPAIGPVVLGGARGVDPRLSPRASPIDGRDSAFFVVLLLENHLKKRFGVATYFCFILKGKNKIRKKTPKCDS